MTHRDPQDDPTDRGIPAGALHADPPRDPFHLFGQWYALAAAQEPQHDAMLLATVSSGHTPSARIVLLKGVDERGFLFFTNFLSRKGRELDENPAVALTLWWRSLGRQVRVEGVAERLPPAESDAYFATRPRDSRLGAHASSQSAPIASRAELDAALESVRQRFAGGEVPRPAHWGGYVVRPHSIEFWQEGAHRLHDRVHYQRQTDGQWTARRLAP